MNAIVVEAAGGPEVLRLAEAAAPVPAAGEVLVEIAAIGVNYTDVYQRRGRPGQQYPFVPGFEAAGTIRELGPQTTGFTVGQRVAYCQIPGAYASLAAVPAARLIALPDALDFERAAAIPLQGMTAHFLVNDYVALAPGRTILIHAAAGGVGLIATQLAARTGARVIGTVSSPEKAALARAAGAHDTIDYTRDDFVAEVKRLTGGAGADLILDGVGKATLTGDLAAVRNRGTIVFYGWPSGVPDPVAPLDLMWRAIELAGGTLSNATLTRAELERRSGELIAAVLAGTLELRIDRVLPLAEAAEAHRLLEARATAGKLLLVP